MQLKKFLITLHIMTGCLISNLNFSQDTVAFLGGNKGFYKAFTRNLEYPQNEIICQKSKLCYAKIYISKSGNIDSVHNIFKENNSFFRVILNSIDKIKSGFKKSKSNYIILIPIYFLFESDTENEYKLFFADFKHYNDILAERVILFQPVFCFGGFGVK
jgi:hypothetical protein